MCPIFSTVGDGIHNELPAVYEQVKHQCCILHIPVVCNINSCDSKERCKNRHEFVSAITLKNIEPKFIFYMNAKKLERDCDDNVGNTKRYNLWPDRTKAPTYNFIMILEVHIFVILFCDRFICRL